MKPFLIQNKKVISGPDAESHSQPSGLAPEVQSEKGRRDYMSELPGVKTKKAILDRQLGSFHGTNLGPLCMWVTVMWLCLWGP